MEIRPEDFWRSTPAEIAAMVAGARAREMRVWEREAWALAHLLNASGKTLRRDVTPDGLLGKKKRIEPKDPEADFARFWAKVDKQRAAGEMN